MHIGWHKLRSKKTKHSQPVWLTNIVNKFIYIAAVFGILSYIPQLLKIWHEKNAAGLSLITWISFLGGSLLWIFYGFIHRERPLIIANCLFLIVQFFIVLGIFIYQ